VDGLRIWVDGSSVAVCAPWLRRLAAREPLTVADLDGPAPRRHPAKGGRTHSPGAAIPSVCLASLSVENRRDMFGKAGKRVSFRTITG
jgi:hypothetical protein